MRSVNRAEAITLLQRAVLDRGATYHLPNRAPAAYFNGTRPLCIVGVALHKVGLRREMLGAFANFTRIDGVTTAKALAQHGWALTDGAKKVFRTAQQASDDGAEWGVALEEAYRAA